MKLKFFFVVFSLFIGCIICKANDYQIVFCGEVIPMSNSFVATKLMNVIKSQIPNAKLPELRNRANEYLPYVEQYLAKEGLPTDFKYLPIVESGFNLLTSHAGASGFWQLMPETARSLGLKVGDGIDERDDIEKSTKAACRVLRDYYNYLKKYHHQLSWVNTAAAYNIGIGNMSNAMKRQGNDYFNMSLNPETALYVYKIIAIKELWENPERYMNGFGYNVFKQVTVKQEKEREKEVLIETENITIDTSTFYQVIENVKSNNGKIKRDEDLFKIDYKGAYIKKNYRKFRDGDFVEIELVEDLVTPGRFTKKGVVSGQGWLIDNRVYIDIDGAYIEVLDQSNKKGVALESMRKNEPIVLKIQSFNDNI